MHEGRVKTPTFRRFKGSGSVVAFSLFALFSLCMGFLVFDPWFLIKVSASFLVLQASCCLRTE